MLGYDLIIAAFVLVPLLFIVRREVRERHRARLMRGPFSPEWAGLLERKVALYRKFAPELKAQLHSLIQVLLNEKSFEGCNGLAITDEVRLTIAAQACMLMLNRKPTFFPKVDAILVYPSAYVATSQQRLGSVHAPQQQVRLGESWVQGLVVLAWDQVERDAAGRIGRNVVLHEFAHQLDQEDGVSDGTPVLHDRELFRSWVQVLGHDYQQLVAETEAGRAEVLDSYGATNAAEFFAVATETFFMQPAALRAHHAELFDVLSSYYRIDPRDWQ